MDLSCFVFISFVYNTIVVPQWKLEQLLLVEDYFRQFHLLFISSLIIVIIHFCTRIDHSLSWNKYTRESMINKILSLFVLLNLTPKIETRMSKKTTLNDRINKKKKEI